MADLLVDPDHLETLAKKHEDSKKYLKAGGAALGGLDPFGLVWDMGWTHGPVCGDGIAGTTRAVVVRDALILCMQAMADALAAGLRVAKTTYTMTNEDAAANLAKQVVDQADA